MALIPEASTQRSHRLGVFCSKGHRRTDYERRYPRAGGGAPVRVCTACQSIREKARRRGEEPAQRPEPMPAAHPDDLRWAEFCHSIDVWIAQERETAAPLCAACEAVQATTTRRCSFCRVVKSLLSDFPRSRSKPLGYGYLCLACKARSNVVSNRARKARAFRRILDGVAS